MKLFLVGKYVADTSAGRVWEFCGVYDSRELALENCITDEFFIAAIDLNATAPDETCNFPECEYPLYVA